MTSISIILPAYNAERYIACSIESILSQVYENFELIIIDDGSTDRTLSIADKYAKSDNRIVLISRENRGLAKSLNEGIRIAKGSWIARMDADDISHPQRLKEQMLFSSQNNIDVCGTAIALFGASKNQVIKYPSTDKEIKFQLSYKCPIAHPSVLMKSDLLKKHLYRENECSEDYDLWCRLAIDGANFANLPTVLLSYRIHPNQISNKRTQEITKSVCVISYAYRRWYFKDCPTDSDNFVNNVIDPNVHVKVLVNYVKQITNYARSIDVKNCDVASRIVQLKYNSLEITYPDAIRLLFGLLWVDPRPSARDCCKLFLRVVFGLACYERIKRYLAK